MGLFFSLTHNLEEKKLRCETWKNNKTMCEAICSEGSTNFVYTLFPNRLWTIYSLGLYKKSAISY